MHAYDVNIQIAKFKFCQYQLKTFKNKFILRHYNIIMFADLNKILLRDLFWQKYISHIYTTKNCIGTS